MAKETTSLADLATTALRNKILDLSLNPSEHLEEKMLLERYPFGRTPIREPLNRMMAEGIALFIAAGNSAGPGTIGTPGSAEDVITVGSLDKNGAIAPYSSEGPTEENRVKPNIAFVGSSVMSVEANTGTGYRSMSGTSMATPGAAGSLAANEAFVIDTTAATVSNVTSSTANGSYKAGDAISIQVVFTEAMTVTGTPQLTLETGSSDAVVDYASGSGGTTLTFTYTVGAGENSSDLEYVNTSSLALNSGTIKDAAGNAATLTLPTIGGGNSLSDNEALVVDTTAATVSNVTSSTNDGSYKAGDAISIQVVFTEVMTVTGTPQLTLETVSYTHLRAHETKANLV